jgi:predicted enzyme related to lactoylglutathione lyase
MPNRTGKHYYFEILLSGSSILGAVAGFAIKVAPRPPEPHHKSTFCEKERYAQSDSFRDSLDNPDRAAEFHTKVFGWKLDKWQGPQDYWLFTTGKGELCIDGGMLRRPHPGAGMVKTIGVASLDAAVEQVLGAGGKTVLPKKAIPGGG